MARALHRHGRLVHAHVERGPHRHLLRGRRLSSPVHGAGRHDRQPDHGLGRHKHEHRHGLIDESIERSHAGLRDISLSLVVLGLTAVAQALIFVATGSMALLADLIHNIGDASTAFPLGVAFALRGVRAERWAGLAVVLAISLSACVAGYEAIDRLVHPQAPDHPGALAVGGGIGFTGNWLAAGIRTGRASAWTAPR